MRTRAVIASLLAMLACTAAPGEDLFGDPVEQIDAHRREQQATPDAPAPQPPHLRFVVGATQATITQKLESAVRELASAADRAGTRGDMQAYERLTSQKLDMMRSIDAMRNQPPMLPSIYPIAVGQTGCLYAVREMETVIRAGEERLTLPLQMVSWFKVKVTAANADQSYSGEIYDATGKTRLYKVRLFDAGPLRPGTTVQMINVQFECVTEELEEDGSVFHLRKLPPELTARTGTRRAAS